MLLEGLGIHLLTPLQTICAYEAKMLCKELEIKKKQKGPSITDRVKLLCLKLPCWLNILVQGYSAALSK